MLRIDLFGNAANAFRFGVEFQTPAVSQISDCLQHGFSRPKLALPIRYSGITEDILPVAIQQFLISLDSAETVLLGDLDENALFHSELDGR
jgi:hypothetical protein